MKQPYLIDRLGFVQLEHKTVPIVLDDLIGDKKNKIFDEV
jgi:hypothetical protein